MKKILITDDSIFMRNYIKDLVSEDFEVVGEANNGKQAVELYKEYKPDVVTMDMTMDIMSGLTALKEIIRFDKNANVVMCSALGQEYLINEALESGAKAYINKPFNKEDLLKVLNFAIDDYE